MVWSPWSFRSLGAALALALAAHTGAVGAARAQDAPPSSPTARSITVTGIGKVAGAPDTAHLQFAVEQSAETATAASQAAAAAAERVLTALRTEVGAGGKVETAGFSLTPVYRHEEPKPGMSRPSKPEIVGYTAVNQVRVTTRQIDRVGALIDAAIAAGAARVGNLAFAIEALAPVQTRALAAAGADAQRQAAAIATALGVRLGPLLEATTESGFRPLPQYGRVAMSAEAMHADTPIEPGEVTTEAQLRVRYAIE